MEERLLVGKRVARLVLLELPYIIALVLTILGFAYTRFVTAPSWLLGIPLGVIGNRLRQNRMASRSQQGSARSFGMDAGPPLVGLSGGREPTSALVTGSAGKGMTACGIRSWAWPPRQHVILVLGTYEPNYSL
jgi:hypothetical protein